MNYLKCRYTALNRNSFVFLFIKQEMAEIELTPEMERLAVDNFYEYIHSKAELFLEIGYKTYRKRDAFKMPDFRMTRQKLDLLQTGCRQIIEYRGMTPDTAFENIGIPGFYRLMKLFHYQVYKQATSGRSEAYFLDEMYMKHTMTGQKMMLYNKVKKNDNLK